MIKIADFIKEWRKCGKDVKEFSFDPGLSEKGHQSKDKALRTSLLALVAGAISQLATTLDANIQAGNVTRSVVKPAVEVFAYPGHHEQKANRL